MHPAIRYTIYLSLICYLLAMVCWVSRQRGVTYRLLWTAGCVFMWAHAVAAFHFYHHWSHAHAVALTAAETAQVIGRPMGQGIWFSYLMIVGWSVDCLLTWRPDDKYRRWMQWFSFWVHLYVLFILFNGTVVFETGVVRWVGVVGTLWMARLAWRYRRTTNRWE